ncbi:MAG: hypothetical protein IKD79_04265, partial [Oscillospiraceae bacterium]|nr:hypothetical protein [Oscillospiraceae bacterium]
MNFQKDDDNIDWKKENGEREKPFDFDAFLDPEENEELDDQVTRLLGGKELLEPDAFGGDTAEYVPSRRGDGDRGRHEAPEPETTAVEGSWEMETPSTEDDGEADGDGGPEGFDEAEEEPAFDARDPRYAAPERPRIIVAEPRKKVYIEPDTEEDFETEDRPRRGMSEALKWIIAALVVIAIMGGMAIAILGSPSSILGFLSSLLPGAGQKEQADNTPRITYAPAAVTPTPVPTPEVTPETQIDSHYITVTASAGGTVSPSGSVAVRDGESVTFSIVPDSNHALSQLIVDGAPVDLGGTYTFHDVTRDHTIYAVFEATWPDPTPEEIETEPPHTEPEPTPVPTPEPTPVPTPEPITPEPVTPEPVTPEPITPEPITPEPITPEPIPETVPEPI